MPNKRKNHGELRALVCLLCGLKGSAPRKIAGQLLIKVQTHFMTNYDPETMLEPEKFPSSCCSKCYNDLAKIDKGKKSPEDLPDPIDFRQLQFPRVGTRSSGVQCLDEMIDCDCHLCTIGRAKPGDFGNSFGGSQKHKGPHPMGRPKHQGPPTLAVRKPVTICNRCKQILGKGIPHPADCSITDFRQNVEKMLDTDPRGKEIIASKVVQSKAKVSPSSASPSTISLATAGPSRQLSLNVNTRSRKKALYANSPIPASAWAEVESGGHLTGAQSTFVSKKIRSFLGRDTFESHLDKKSQENTHTLEQFYSTKKCPLDSKQKSIRDSVGQVDKIIVHINDLLPTMEYVCNARGYKDGLSNTYLKLSGDTGQGSYKMNVTIECLNDDKSATDSSDKKWSYEQGLMAGNFKDGGIKGLIICGKINREF